MHAIAKELTAKNYQDLLPHMVSTLLTRLRSTLIGCQGSICTWPELLWLLCIGYSMRPVHSVNMPISAVCSGFSNGCSVTSSTWSMNDQSLPTGSIDGLRWFQFCLPQRAILVLTHPVCTTTFARKTSVHAVRCIDAALANNSSLQQVG